MEQLLLLIHILSGISLLGFLIFSVIRSIRGSGGEKENITRTFLILASTTTSGVALAAASSSVTIAAVCANLAVYSLLVLGGVLYLGAKTQDLRARDISRSLRPVSLSLVLVVVGLFAQV